jgi:AcrR family transcriptional regulator
VPRSCHHAQNSTIVRFIGHTLAFHHLLHAVTHTSSSSSDPATDAAAAHPRPLMKGRQTRAAILDAALALASHMGLEGLSIGALAEVTQMSKSGVFAHFGSREELQISVVREYHAKFAEEVFEPAMAVPRGLPRLRALFDRWFKRVSIEIDAGCIYISGAVEFDDRPGPVRDALVAMVQTWQNALERAIRIAIAEGHLRPDTDTKQMLFEVHGLILALHHDARFLRHEGADARARKAFENVLSHYTTAAAASPATSAAASKTTPAKRARAAPAV